MAAPTNMEAEQDIRLTIHETSPHTAEVRSENGDVLATINAGNDGVLTIMGNAISAIIQGDTAPVRTADILLNPSMPPPPFRSLHYRLTSNSHAVASETLMDALTA